jgi:hypothetical protein
LGPIGLCDSKPKANSHLKELTFVNRLGKIGVDDRNDGFSVGIYGFSFSAHKYRRERFFHFQSPEFFRPFESALGHARMLSANSTHSSIDYAWSDSALYLKDLNNGVSCRCSRDECEAGVRTTFYVAGEHWLVIAPG